MNILQELGMPITGMKWPWEAQEFDEDINPRDRERIEKRQERRKELNPNGFWEVPGVVMRGVSTPCQKWNQNAIKIVSSGMYPQYYGGELIGTSPECYDKSILCLRNPRAVAKSQINLESGVERADDDGWDTARLIVQPAPFVQRTGQFLTWLSNQSKDIKNKFLIVDFDNLLQCPEKQIGRICEHLDINYTKTDVIEPCLKRSHLPEWPSQVKDIGTAADKLYKLTLNRDWGSISTEWQFEYEEIVDSNRRENTKWCDTEWGTYRLISPDLWRGLRDNDKNVRDKLTTSPKQAFHNYTESLYYLESDETYTIERPHDIGDLTRPLIHCTHPNWKIEMTHERFRALWKDWGRE